MTANSGWLSAHGKLWYDDPRYRLAWLVWPQALVAVFVVLFWASPPSARNVPWAKPADTVAREQMFIALREKARSDRSAMDQLERQARGGEMMAEFYYGTLLDPNLKLSTIVPSDFTQASDWYGRAAAQGFSLATTHLAFDYFEGRFVRADYTRGCFYARKLSNDAFADAVRIKGDCYARGLGGTTTDWNEAAAAYEMASKNGNARASATLGYFYENGIGGKERDAATALRLYRAAADKGDSLGLHNLAAAYNNGTLGVQPDGGEAARLIFQALRNKFDVTYHSLTTQSQAWTPDFWQSLQRRMAENGVYSGPIDGRPNPTTLEAVRRLSGQ